MLEIMLPFIKKNLIYKNKEKKLKENFDPDEYEVNIDIDESLKDEVSKSNPRLSFRLDSSIVSGSAADIIDLLYELYRSEGNIRNWVLKNISTGEDKNVGSILDEMREYDDSWNLG